MGTKHTPGPWEAQYTIVIGPDSEVVADTSCKGARQSPRDTQKANARLIAVAPEMLAFIRRVAFEPVGLSDASHETVLDILTADARALLAKIEGGE